MATPIKSGIRKDYVDLTTRLPAPVMADLKHRLAPTYGGTLTAMYDVMMRTFLRDMPWLYGLKWRETQALSRREETIKRTTTADGQALDVPVTTTVATGWIQVNMRLNETLAERIKSAALANGVSPSTVLYTGVYYWIWYKNPTPEIKKIREARLAKHEARQRALAEDAKHGE